MVHTYGGAPLHDCYTITTGLLPLRQGSQPRAVTQVQSVQRSEVAHAAYTHIKTQSQGTAADSH